MVNVAQILALSKLTSETPDDVRTAATMMVVGGAKNPLITGIASANMVQSATEKAVAETSATAAKVKAEAKAVTLEAEIAAIRPVIEAVATKVQLPASDATADSDGYTKMVAALKAGKTVESVMQDLNSDHVPDKVATSSVTADTAKPIMISDIQSEDTKVIAALATAALAVKETLAGELTDKRRRQAAMMLEKMLGLPSTDLKGLNSLEGLKAALANNA